jgi:hypothetical protein
MVGAIDAPGIEQNVMSGYLMSSTCEGIELARRQPKKLLRKFNAVVSTRVARLFSCHNVPKRKKMYRFATKLPNGRNRYIPNVLRIYQPFPFQGPPKFTPIGIFGLKIYHLATLVSAKQKQKTDCVTPKKDSLET